MPTCRAARGPQNPKVNDVVLFVPVADGAAEHPIIRHQGFHVRSRPDPGADVAGVSPVTVQTRWTRAEARRRCGSDAPNAAFYQHLLHWIVR